MPTNMRLPTGLDGFAGQQLAVVLPCQPDGYVENIDGEAGSNGKNTDDDVDGGAVAEDGGGGGDPLLLLTPRLDR